MIRKLADRLASLDLLDQAAELLRHQVDNRLSGVARAQVAARLAVVQMMNRKPMEAVETLRKSRLAELPADLKRARALLEARALSELSRTDLAVEMIAAESGADIDRLRSDIHWRGKRWREAGEAFEVVVGARWEEGGPLEAHERLDVLRAGIAYVLANERLALDRLRGKFSPKMADSPDARMFELVSNLDASGTREFRNLARSVVSVETFSEFLEAYRRRYPEIAGKPRDAAAINANTRAPAGPQAGDAAGRPDAASQPLPQPKRG